jgi:hypothetical protein
MLGLDQRLADQEALILSTRRASLGILNSNIATNPTKPNTH